MHFFVLVVNHCEVPSEHEELERESEATELRITKAMAEKDCRGKEKACMAGMMETCALPSPVRSAIRGPCRSAIPIYRSLIVSSRLVLVLSFIVDCCLIPQIGSQVSVTFFLCTSRGTHYRPSLGIHSNKCRPVEFLRRWSDDSPLSTLLCLPRSSISPLRAALTCYASSCSNSSSSLTISALPTVQLSSSVPLFLPHRRAFTAPFVTVEISDRSTIRICSSHFGPV
jgi:hypothetical protein